MGSMKRFFASLGVGVLIPALLVAFILTLKILFPGTTSGMFMLWFFVWPMPLFFRVFPGLGTETNALLAFAIGTVVDIALLTFLAYRALGVVRRSEAPTH
jgi:hypothetical protein